MSHIASLGGKFSVTQIMLLLTIFRFTGSLIKFYLSVKRKTTVENCKYNNKFSICIVFSGLPTIYLTILLSESDSVVLYLHSLNTN